MAAAIDALCGRPARVEIFPGQFSQWADLEAELVRVADAADAIQVFGLDEWLDDRSHRARTESLMRAWNVRRDGFARDVPIPVLCWLRAATLNPLARFAPDLWSWRAGVHSFAMKRSTEKLADQRVPAFAAHTRPIDNRTIGQKTQRLRNIRQYLDENLPSDDAALALHGELLDELASLHASLGQLDEALRIRKEDQLPVYERLGDVREKAVTQGKIADILQARGQLDEALRIRKEEELPVYERLGDVREKAITQSRIANILQARGQFDEALVLHAHQLPVAERMGDREGIASIKYATASIRFQQGDHQTGGLQAIHDDLAEAFAISRQLERPDAIGVIGALLAQVLAISGSPQEALSVLDAAETAYKTLGDAAGLAKIRALREQIAPNE